MSTKICKAILDLRPDDWDGIHNQGEVFLSHLYVETILYPTPIIAEVDFKALVTAAGEALTEAIKGDDADKALREETGEKLYTAMGQKLIPYINGLWSGNKVNLEKSGAKVSADPSPVPPPDTPTIKKIVPGPEPASVKVCLIRGINSTLKKRSRTLYRVFMFEKEDDAKGVEVGSSYNSNKLYGYDIPLSVYRYYGVSAQNSGGTSPLSSKTKFYLST